MLEGGERAIENQEILSHISHKGIGKQIKLFITFGININCFQKGNSYRMVDVSILSGQ